MALYFYLDKEGIHKEDSINNYKGIFQEYIKKNPNLEEALSEMYISENISDLKVKNLKEDILSKSAEIIRNNFFIIKEKYPTITYEEAQIISSYNCISYDPDFSPYKILNKNLCKENREEGIKNVSKYFYIFLKSLRKLDRYFINKNYLYKCIDKKVNIMDDEKRIIYKRGIIKIFWGFTSFSTFINKRYIIGDKEKIIESGTIFALYGNIYGYDISLFNSLMSDEIILEPEQKCEVIDAIPSNKNSKFINIRLKSKDFNNILPNIFINNDVIYEHIEIPKLIKIVYKFPYYKTKIPNEREYITIFGDKFVENNRKCCKLIYENKEYNLESFFEITDIIGDKLEIYLKGFDRVNNLYQMFSNSYLYSCDDIYITSNIVNMSEMFKECNSLLTLSSIDKWDTSNVSDMSYLFFDCSKLSSLPDISKWNTSNVTNITHIFGSCSNLLILPDISRWTTSKMTNLSYAFYNCKSLKSLPDISKWDVSNVTNMKYMFYGCSSLSSLPELSIWNLSKVIHIMYLFAKCSSLTKLPNISKWNISNINNLSSLFSECKHLLSLPDISKWNMTNVSEISYIFENCTQLKTLPDISKWDTSNILYMDYAFHYCSSLLYLSDISKWKMNKVLSISSMLKNCSSLTFLPDISKWDISSVNNMNSFFEGCISLSFLPDISKWDTSKVLYINNIFYNCKLLSYLPDISKWNTSNIINMNYMFAGCSSLVYIPDISLWKTEKLKNINNMFRDCLSLAYLPNLSKWNNIHLIHNSDLILNSINCLPHF